MDAWRAERGQPPYRSNQERLCDIKQFYASEHEKWLEQHRRVVREADEREQRRKRESNSARSVIDGTSESNRVGNVSDGATS